ncbi:MAG TPA: helix-turn-helix domain-containing protein [Pseudonocardiaceae bacterium]|jgi:hypothetical protein|nr:helix-turn-helix domain-containing protein [Pseudonocardiaceae bacterium]
MHPQDAGGGAEPVSLLPRQLAALMRPEMASVAKDIITEVRRGLPEYARPLDGPYSRSLRIAVEQTIGSFVDQVADPSTPVQRRDELLRRLGRNEALEGRGLDSLQAAYRIGARVAWQRIMRMGRRHNLSSSVMSLLADVLFGYIDQLAALSQNGYREARGHSAQAREQARGRLARLLLTTPPVPPAVLVDVATEAGWTVPAEVTAVVIGEDTAVARPLLDSDVLLDPTDPPRYLLLPGPVTDDRRAMLAASLPVGRRVIGLPVPSSAAADSLRWARQAAELIDRPGAVDCADHLPELLLLSDAALLDQLAARRLAPFNELTDKQRARMLATLGAWLDTRGSAPEIADLLHVHPQTVRYRMRQLDKTLGDQLADPGRRFELELVLRALRLRTPEAGAPGGHRSRAS